MPLPDPPVEIEFRDGARWVPAHLASNIAVSGVDPQAYTFEEMVEISNKAIERNFINDFQLRAVQRHFVVNR